MHQLLLDVAARATSINLGLQGVSASNREVVDFPKRQN
jgi:hypothetical protein